MKFPGRALALLFGAVVGAGGAGALIAFLLIQPPTPESLEPSVAISSAPVAPQTFSDPKPVDIIIRRGMAVDVRVAMGGLLTSGACSPGGAAQSGSTSFAVDGIPLLNLHTTVPLWRTVSPGDSGADIDAIKAELGRLKLAHSDGPRLGWADLDSLGRMMQKNGRDVSLESLAPGDVVWLSQPKISFASCSAGINAAVEAGAVVATAEGIADISAGEAPPGLMPGARTLVVDDLKLEIDASLRIVDQAASAAVLETAAYRTAIGESEAGQPVTIAAMALLVDPVPAVALPPGAVTVQSGTTGCVTSEDGTTQSVTILTSQLGSTVVAFDGEAPTSVRVQKTSSCT